jgi:hypothetical protein
MEWSKPTTFDANNVAPWVTSSWDTPVKSTPIIRPDFADNEDLKKAYGIELGRGLDAFNAAMEVFNQVLPSSLWASLNWIKDPIVIASRDAYQRTLKKSTPPLDKEELLAEVLEGARKSEEDKDRVAFLKLYSEIAGYTGKIAIDASTINNNNTQNNTTQIVLVKGTQNPNLPKTISPDTNIKSKIQNNGLPPLKLVSGGSV